MRSSRLEPTISITDDLHEQFEVQNLDYEDEGNEDALSPTGESHGRQRRGNVFFEASAKNDGGVYEKLRARISRMFISPDFGSISHLCRDH